MIQGLLKELDTSSDKINLIVYDVGHGNWNEVQFGKTRIFFDIGAQKEWRENRIQRVVEGVNIKDNEQIYIFISHWDVDHYHSIFKMSNSQLRCIKGFFAPIRIPNTNTARRVQELLSDVGVRLVTIPFTVKRDKDRKIELNLGYQGKKLKIYRSTQTRSRNLDSIVFYLETDKKSVLLTGDQKYEKLYDYIISTISPKSPLIFILPHHGGYAGNFNITHWSRFHIEEVVISYDTSNNYGHPFAANLLVAQDLLKPKSVLCTNGSGDKTFSF